MVETHMSTTTRQEVRLSRKTGTSIASTALVLKFYMWCYFELFKHSNVQMKFEYSNSAASLFLDVFVTIRESFLPYNHKLVICRKSSWGAVRFWGVPRRAWHNWDSMHAKGQSKVICYLSVIRACTLSRMNNVPSRAFFQKSCCNTHLTFCDMGDGHKWSHFQICDRGQKCLICLDFLSETKKVSPTKRIGFFLWINQFLFEIEWDQKRFIEDDSVCISHRRWLCLRFISKMPLVAFQIWLADRNDPESGSPGTFPSQVGWRTRNLVTGPEWWWAPN